MNKIYIVLLIGAFGILFILVILTSIIGKSSQSAPKTTYKQTAVNYNFDKPVTTFNKLNNAGSFRSSSSSKEPPTQNNNLPKAADTKDDLTPQGTSNTQQLALNKNNTSNSSQNPGSSPIISPAEPKTTITKGLPVITPIPTIPPLAVLENPNDEKKSIKFQGVNLGPDKKDLSPQGGFIGSLNNENNTSPIDIQKSYTSSTGLTYYSQCDGLYDNYPIPGGCNICQSGCGPATVAMILSSYVDSKFTPSYVVDQYKEKGLFLGCEGTKITDAQYLLNNYGLKTTDLLYLTNLTKEESLSELKSYLRAGWTIYMLGRFCDSGCGHFFWITDIDENNIVWTYDPYYGKKQLPPLNTGKYDPFPKYRIAFGVKKN